MNGTLDRVYELILEFHDVSWVLGVLITLCVVNTHLILLALVPAGHQMFGSFLDPSQTDREEMLCFSRELWTVWTVPRFFQHSGPPALDEMFFLRRWTFAEQFLALPVLQSANPVLPFAQFQQLPAPPQFGLCSMFRFIWQNGSYVFELLKRFDLWCEIWSYLSFWLIFFFLLIHSNWISFQFFSRDKLLQLFKLISFLSFF